MGRVKELYLQEERIKLERAEAAFFALPEAQAEALSGIQQLMASHLQLVNQNTDLQTQLATLQDELQSANSPAAKWKERAFGFAFGIAASVVASLSWAQAIRQWPSLAYTGLKQCGLTIRSTGPIAACGQKPAISFWVFSHMPQRSG